MVTGGFSTAEGMADALRFGALDVIGLGRPLTVTPDLIGRLLDGEEIGAERLSRKPGSSWPTAGWRSSGTPSRCTGSPPGNRSTCAAARSGRWCTPGSAIR